MASNREPSRIRAARPRVHLIHWHGAEAKERAEHLSTLGFATVWSSEHGGEGLRSIQREPPDVVVIDLGRLPSHGRRTAIALCEQMRTRHLPLVFVGGEAAEHARVKTSVPNAHFTTWGRIVAALRRAIASQPENPPVPPSAGYSGTPLPRKLGIRPGSRLLLLGAPADFGDTLGELPPAVETRTRLRGTHDVIVLFVDSSAALSKRFPTALRCLAEGGGLWVAWPKKTSGVVTDLTEDILREVCLPTGLVDNKVCAIDATWSGLRFVRRRQQPGARRVE